MATDLAILPSDGGILINQFLMMGMDGRVVKGVGGA
jgi:hypothetical protein